MVSMQDSHNWSVMYCPVCGKQCQVIVEAFCFLCVDCDDQWFYSNGVFCLESSLEPISKGDTEGSDRCI